MPVERVGQVPSLRGQRAKASSFLSGRGGRSGSGCGADTRFMLLKVASGPERCLPEKKPLVT